MRDNNLRKANQETRHAWDVNAAYWDEYMGEGNDFVELSCWPAIERLLIVSPEGLVLSGYTLTGLTPVRNRLQTLPDKAGTGLRGFNSSPARVTTRTAR